MFLWHCVSLSVGALAFGPWMLVKLDLIFGVVKVNKRNNFIDTGPVLKMLYYCLYLAWSFAVFVVTKFLFTHAYLIKDKLLFLPHSAAAKSGTAWVSQKIYRISTVLILACVW